MTDGWQPMDGIQWMAANGWQPMAVACNVMHISEALALMRMQCKACNVGQPNGCHARYIMHCIVCSTYNTAISVTRSQAMHCIRTTICIYCCQQ